MYNEQLTTWREYYLQCQAEKVADTLGNAQELQYFIKILKQIYEEIKEQEKAEGESH